MNNFRKNIYRTKTLIVPPELLFSISSTRIDDGIGTLDIINGEPGETIGLAFDMNPSGTFNSLNFSSPVTVDILDITHLNRTGNMILDGTGSGSSNYMFDPDTADRACLVTVISRDSGLTEGIGDTTNVI